MCEHTQPSKHSSGLGRKSFSVFYLILTWTFERRFALMRTRICVRETELCMSVFARLCFNEVGNIYASVDYCYRLKSMLCTDVY